MVDFLAAGITGLVLYVLVIGPILASVYDWFHKKKPIKTSAELAAMKTNLPKIVGFILYVFIVLIIWVILTVFFRSVNLR